MGNFGNYTNKVDNTTTVFHMKVRGVKTSETDGTYKVVVGIVFRVDELRQTTEGYEALLIPNTDSDGVKIWISSCSSKPTEIQVYMDNNWVIIDMGGIITDYPLKL